VTGPPLVAGPHAPATATPPRPPGSVRRTTSIDTAHPDCPNGDLVVDARGRDLRTDPDGVDREGLLGEGTDFDDLRLRVRRELVGTASCTHLNDTLRSLADLGALLPSAGVTDTETIIR
jgi:Protein of unknown function (DUF2889)